MNIQELEAALKAAGCHPNGGEALCPHPDHDDHDPSFSYRELDGVILMNCFVCAPEDKTERGVWFREVIGNLDGRTVYEPEHEVRRNGSSSSRPGRMITWAEAATLPDAVVAVETYEYLNADGGHAFYKDRRDFEDGSKTFVIYDRTDGQDLVLYRLDKLVGLEAGSTVFVVEGERKVHQLESWGFVAVCAPNGSKSWKSEWSELFAGLNVVLMPDNDIPGKEYTSGILKDLKTVATSRSVVHLPGLEEKGDIVDWVAAGGTREEFEELCGKAVTFNREKSPREVDDEIKAKIAADMNGVIYNAELIKELYDIGSFRAESIYARFISEAPQGGVTARRDAVRQIKGIVAAAGAAVQAAAAGVATDEPWVVVKDYGDRHGVWKRRVDFAGAVEMEKWIDEAVSLSGILVVDGVEDSLELDFSPAHAGRDRRIVLPTDVITTRSPAELIHGASGVAWTPAQASKVQEYLAYVVQNSQDSVRKQGFRKPCWLDGRLVLPATETDLVFVGSKDLKKYGEYCEGDEAEALEAAGAMYHLGVEHWKVGVGMGTAMSSLFLDVLGLDGYVCHYGGDSTQGKTTAARAAMSIYGCGKDLENNWRMTPNAFTAMLSGAGIVPLLLDDTGSADPRNIDSLIQQVIFTASDGHDKKRATVTGELRVSSPACRISVLSTGERMLTTASKKSGLKARVIEMSQPILPDRETALLVTETANASHGWAIQKVLEMGQEEAVELFSRLQREIEPAAIGMVVGAIEQRLAKTVSAAVAGLAFYGVLTGVEESVALSDALDVCAHVLGASVSNIKESGGSVADHLSNYLAEVIQTHPFKWASRIGMEVNPAFEDKPAPEPGTFGAIMEPVTQPTDSSVMVTRDLWGYADNEYLYVLPNALNEIAARIDIEDVSIALRTMAEDGRLTRPASAVKAGTYQSSANLYNYKLKKTVKTRCYVFVLDKIFPSEDE